MKQMLVTVVVAALTAWCVALWQGHGKPAEQADDVYARVLGSGVLRCGYTPYSVGLMKDANSGKLSGIYKDLVEAVAAKLDVQVEWVEEVGWAQQIEGLNSGRFDLVCSPASVTGPRSRAAAYSIPLYYSPVLAWGRRGDSRFASKAAINTPAVTVATMDGEQTAALAATYFPQAKALALPQGSDFSQLLLNVATRKADVTFAEPLVVRAFMETNRDSLQPVMGSAPLVLVPNILLMKNGEFRFQSMLDGALREVVLSGQLDVILDTYETYPGSYVRTRGYY